jgi:tetratricopeptide (TPR) repeat protein
MSKKLKISLGVLSVLILAGLAGGVYWYLTKETRLYNQIKDKPQLVELWNKAKNTEEKIKQKPEEAGYYMESGLDWKSLGEISEIKEFLSRSLSAYEEGIKKFGQKNILFYLNAGNLAEQMGDYTKAESYFKKAIEISSADESGYIELADLYSYKMKKSEAEVVKVYESGMKILMNPAPLIYARGSYLRRIGDYKNALEDYKVLSQNYPDHQGYKEIVSELEGLIKNNQ